MRDSSTYAAFICLVSVKRDDETGAYYISSPQAKHYVNKNEIGMWLMTYFDLCLPIETLANRFWGEERRAELGL